MKRIKRGGGSPAILVAGLALIAAVAGTALADSEPTATSAKGAKKLAKEAKKKANKANKNAKAAQGAADSAQGSANSAQGTADSAQGAADSAQGTADTALAGSAKMSYSAGENTPEQVILNVGGLVVRASCAGGPNLSITAETTANDSNIHIGTIESVGNISAGEQHDDWDIGEPAANLDGDSTDADNIQGTLTYRNGANDTVVTLTYLLEEQGGIDRCRAVGNATIL